MHVPYLSGVLQLKIDDVLLCSVCHLPTDAMSEFVRLLHGKHEARVKRRCRNQP